jgi:ribosomal protein S15P/S13E
MKLATQSFKNENDNNIYMAKEKTEKKKLTQKEYEAKIHELAKEGLTAEKIGQKLKDEGIHPSEFKGKISKILGERYVNPDLKNVEEKLEKIKAHYEKNKQDKRAKREKDRVFSQLRKIKIHLGLIQKKK